jgi:ABC-type uncharacterized transport system permease subunit
LWQFIYGGQGGGTLINGYTLEMMIWYMIMAEIFMYSVNARGVTRAFSNDIKSGKIAYQLNKPYNYYAYQIATESGVSCWKLCFLLPTAILMGLILVGPIANFKVYYIFPILLSLALGLLLLCAVYGIVGLLAFWIEESTPFTWIIQKFIMLFGLFFPPECGGPDNAGVESCVLHPREILFDIRKRVLSCELYNRSVNELLFHFRVSPFLLNIRAMI